MQSIGSNSNSPIESLRQVAGGEPPQKPAPVAGPQGPQPAGVVLNRPLGDLASRPNDSGPITRQQAHTAFEALGEAVDAKDYQGTGQFGLKPQFKGEGEAALKSKWGKAEDFQVSPGVAHPSVLEKLRGNPMGTGDWGPGGPGADLPQLPDVPVTPLDPKVLGPNPMGTGGLGTAPAPKPAEPRPWNPMGTGDWGPGGAGADLPQLPDVPVTPLDPKVLGPNPMGTGGLGGPPAAPGEASDPGKVSKVSGEAGKVIKDASELARRVRRVGGAGPPGLGLAGDVLALPANIGDAKESIEKAIQTGSAGDIARATADSTSLGSNLTSGLKGAAELTEDLYKRQVLRAAAGAFKQVAPDATKPVLNAAARTAADEALKEATEKAARRATTAAATQAAKEAGTLAGGVGAINRAAAKELLENGGEAAAKAAARAAAQSGLKTAAKAAGRFVPGLNVGIAVLDTATAAATLADPKASLGKKATSVITAAGSIIAATNIPIVSQIGGAISAVSSLVGSFF